MADRPPSPSEMISGPDLGGGYLHQLSIDRRDDVTTFTHHAQEGGQDAGGPPVGALDVLGFVHPPVACMFGGPRCWHRRYLLPFAATPRVRFAYQRSRFVLETMLRQAWDLEPVPFEAALGELRQRIAAPLRDEGIEWYVAGSGAVKLAGGGGEPHDIDLGVGRAGVDRLGSLLAEYLIEPVAPTDGPGGEIRLGGRAFVGSPRQGARVEWSVPIEPLEPRRWEELVGVPGVTRTLEVGLGSGQTVRISRPEYVLVRAAVRGRPGAVDAALRALRQVGPDLELLEALLERSPLGPDERRALRARAAAPG